MTNLKLELTAFFLISFIMCLEGRAKKPESWMIMPFHWPLFEVTVVW